MTSADIAVAVFTACNSLRVLAYLPQIVRVGRDTGGAAAISSTTWVLFAVSHLSTVAYALVVAKDERMAAVFAANTACCLAIIGLTAYKRHRHRQALSAATAARVHPSPSGRPAHQDPPRPSARPENVVAPGPSSIAREPGLRNGFPVGRHVGFPAYDPP